MSTVGQVIADPDFAKLSPQDQQGVLTHFDPDFGKLNPAEFPRVVEGIRNKGVPSNQQPENSSSLSPKGKAIATGQAPPQVTPKPEAQDASLSDYGSIAATTASVMAPEALGMAGKALAAGRAATATAETAEAAGPKVKTLGSLIKTAMSKGELEGAATSAGNYKELTDTAFEAAAEAQHAGKHVEAAKYLAVALLGKFGAGYEQSFLKLGQATKGYSAVAITGFGWYEALKAASHIASSAVKAVSGDNEEK